MKSDDRTTATAAIVVDGAREAPAIPEQAFLVVYDEARGRVVPLPDGVEISIGRLESCAIAIDHEAVSRRHARIIRRRADIVVEDCGSRNGTRINGVRIDGATRVSTGDEITVGPASVVVGVTSGMHRETLVGSSSDFEERLAAELDRAIRYRRPLGLAMMRLEGSAEATGAAVEDVGVNLRRMDYLAQYGPGEFAVILPEANSAATSAAAERIARIARDAGARRGGIGIHVGVAVCPDDGAQTGELLSKARAALRAARSKRSRVAGAPKEAAPAPGAIVVVDPLMKRVFSMARKVADAGITVLILGETGAGKEIVANAIHQQSKRASKPFQALNCSALPETLLESELFGHEKGAFTGADRRKVGYFEAAGGGTVFLDEVGEMPLSVQTKLLRVLEQRTITRVGGTQQVPIEVRVVCATNRDLEAEVRRGRFREDLFFRISAFTLVVPPLRDRGSEILPMAQHFARQFSLELGQPMPELTTDARDALEGYDWPGNIRELRNAIERAVVLQPGGAIGVEHLPERISDAPRRGGLRRGTNVKDRIADVERETVVAALDATAGNQTHAARRLGISRFALIRLMEKYGLKKPRRSKQ